MINSYSCSILISIRMGIVTFSLFTLLNIKAILSGKQLLPLYFDFHLYGISIFIISFSVSVILYKRNEPLLGSM